jgi:hypothetical protein
MYININLPNVLYGCKNWTLTLMEDKRLGMFENSVLRRVLCPKSDEVAGEWRRLHDEKLCDLCSSPIIVGFVQGCGGKHEGKRPLGGPRLR